MIADPRSLGRDPETASDRYSHFVAPNLGGDTIMTLDALWWSELLNLSARFVCTRVGILRLGLDANRNEDICRVPCCPMLGKNYSCGT